MNRSILIVICDFLLVSLLAFSTVDIDKVANSASAGSVAVAAPVAASPASGRQELGDVMRLALEDERKQQDALAHELALARGTASQQETLLKQRDAQVQGFQQQLRSQQAQAAQLETQQTNLVREVAAAQNNIALLRQQLQSNTFEYIITREERARQEAETKKQMARAAALQQQLSALQRSNQMVLAERAQLADQLQLTESEKRAAAAQLAQAQGDLDVQRQENVRLAEGVKTLGAKSSELAQEIRENRPLTPNTIFNDFAANRVTVNFQGVRPGFFGGDSPRSKQTETILVTDGTNTWALCHVQETLFTLWDPGTAWRELSGTLSRSTTEFPASSISFYLADPRVALIPVPREWVPQLGCKVYHLSSDPFKFQDAVVVGAREGYYGQCNFQIDLTAPQYLKMDRNSLKGLFGKFNPSTGDLVFSKSGDLLGVMANNTYCITLRNFDTAATFQFGTDTRSQPIAETLSSLYSTVMGLPFKLQ